MVQLTREQQLLVCAHALLDPRTMSRYVAGHRIQPLTRERIERTLVQLGFALAAKESK